MKGIKATRDLVRDVVEKTKRLQERGEKVEILRISYQIKGLIREIRRG